MLPTKDNQVKDYQACESDKLKNHMCQPGAIGATGQGIEQSHRLAINNKGRWWVRLMMVGLLFAACATSQVLVASSASDISPYSASAESDYPLNVYWGDAHVHTNLSTDAYFHGNSTFGPDVAYRFAKGEGITTLNGMTARIDRPLDFIVIADHANSMGLMDRFFNQKDSQLLNTKQGERWLQLLSTLSIDGKPNKEKEITYMIASEMWNGEPSAVEKTSISVWQKAVAQADNHNQSGQFTAFIGFEWTPQIFGLHRVVIYKDDASKIRNRLPFSSYTSSDPEGLWRYMEDYQNDTGGEVIAIPHNANLTGGVMFALEDAQGRSMSRAYAETRSRWEPLLEVTQMKGDSETHPLLSPEDEFANFERLSFDLSAILKAERRKGYTDYQRWYEKNEFKVNNDDWMRTYEYARSALKLGLQQQAKLGVNPFKFGMIGSTDSHTSLSTAEEYNFWGKLSLSGPNKDRMFNAWDGTAIDSDVGKRYGSGWKQNAAGYAAVWAKKNTRESLFAAMKRKEVYATTGPRMTVRFFGGWDYQAADAFSPHLARIGYDKGIPMGGDLTQAPANQPPQFLIQAIRDPYGANLDRVQVIKGWHSKEGDLHEKIYNVALSDNRKENRKGKVKPVGNTVDITGAAYTNTIGDPELATVWTDPDFNAADLAFYYLRVLEIPTPRWTAYDAKSFTQKNIPDGVAMVTQERAYTSPIWYSPPAKAGGE